MRQQGVIFSHKHPKEMYLLALSEMCQRFAYWGVGYLLILFLVKYFSYSTKYATNLFGIYTGTAFLLPILGGYVADKWNCYTPILLGSILTAIGCFFLSTLTKVMIIPALIVIGFGGGLFTPNIYTLLGILYSDKQHIREGGFSIYYAAVNVGVLIAMIILGYLQTVNWSVAFIVAGCVQLLGIFPYFTVVSKLKNIDIPHRHFTSKKADPHHYPLKTREVERIIVILIMTCISIFFWMAYNQAGSSMTLFALRFTNRHIAGFEVPVPWFTSMQTLFLILFSFPLARLYLFLKRLKSNASPPMKTALSLFFTGLCFLVMHRAATHVPPGAMSANISPGYLLCAFALLSLAELFLTPIGLSLITNLSPHRYRGLLTGLWFTCIGFGFYLGGYLAGFMTSISLPSFFGIFVITSFLPALLLALFSKKLDRMRHISSL